MLGRGLTANAEEGSKFTVTEKLLDQHRFFCENCRQEVFLIQKYCDKCGGKIEWPKEYRKIAIAFKKIGQAPKEKKSSLFGRSQSSHY